MKSKALKIVTICGVFLVQEKEDQECQKSDFHQRNTKSFFIRC